MCGICGVGSGECVCGVSETGCVVECVCDMSGAVCLCDVYVRGLHMGGSPLQPWGEAP